MKPNLLLPAILLALAAAANAAVVVNFDGAGNNAFSPSATGGFTFATGTLSTTSVTDDTATTTITLNTSTPNYTTGQAVTGGNYIGPDLYIGQYSRMQNGSTAQVNNQSAGSIFNGTPDSIRARRNGANADNIAVTQRQAVLLDATGTDPYAFDSSSVLTITSGYGVNITTGAWTADNRWLVLSGGNIYISQSTIGFATNANTFATYTLDNPDEINWGLWNPTSDLTLGSLTYSVAGTALNGITAVGYYVSKDWTGAAANKDPGTLTTSLFTADLAAVPEPTSLALLAGALGSIAVLRRRRRA